MTTIQLKSAAELDKMRASGRLVALVQQEIAGAIHPGVTTGELDRLAERRIREAGARPAFKGYRGFPCTICASIDNEVVHGIPGNRTIAEGSILSIDVGVELDGYYGDMALTHPVGRIDKESQRLINVTRRALAEGIAQVRVGNRLSDIARAVQDYVEARGFSVVREYVGHGIGREMHEPPQVPNFWDSDSGPDRRLREGMVIAIEPMVNRGTWKTRRLRDKWTVVTEDGERSGHFEHTVAVLKDGPEILTVVQ